MTQTPTQIPPAPISRGFSAKPRKDITLGYMKEETPQYGILGKAMEDQNRIVGMDLGDAGTICFFGSPGSGKSYSMGVIIEMAAEHFKGINVLPQPLAVVLMHTSVSESYAPEYLTLNQENRDADMVAKLKKEYPGVELGTVKDIIGIAPKLSRDRREKEFPGIKFYNLTFRSEELQIPHWQILMGAVGDESMYVLELNRLMREIYENNEKISPDAILARLETSELLPADKQIARQRVKLARQYIDDSPEAVPISSHLKQGRVIQVDLRDPFLLKSELLTLLITMLQIFSAVKRPDGSGLAMPKLVVFDEAHKYMSDKRLVSALVELIREMRHQSCMLMFASQDPPSVPKEIIELSTGLVMCKFASPLWIKHIQSVHSCVSNVSPANMVNLKPGEAYVWFSKSPNPTYTEKAWKVAIRPRCTQHGGATKSAVMTDAASNRVQQPV